MADLFYPDGVLGVTDERESASAAPPSLEEIEAAHRRWMRTPDGQGYGPQAASFVLDNLPILFAELKRWRAMPVVQEFALAPEGSAPAEPASAVAAWRTDGELAAQVARHAGADLWRRDVHQGPWIAQATEPSEAS